MPTLAQIRAAIKTKLEAVADVGKVHDFQRYAKEQSKLAELYVSGDRLKGGFIAWRGQSTVSPGLGRKVVTHRWELTFYRSIDDADATELAFDTMLEAVRAAFQDDENLGGVVSSTVIENDDSGGPAGVQVEEKNAVLFCGVLCHAARGRLLTRHNE